MIYGTEPDFDTIERNAYQAGNTELASLIALLQDKDLERADAFEDLEQDRDAELARANKAEADHEAMRAKAERALTALDDLLKGFPRLAHRAEIDKAVQVIYDALYL